MNNLEIREDSNETIHNALLYMKKHDIGGPFWIKALGTIGGMSILSLGLGMVGFGIPWIVQLLIAGGISNKITDTAYSVYYSRKNSFTILRPETTIVEGRPGLKTISYDLLPQSFHDFFKEDQEIKYLDMGEKEFLEYYNEVIIDYYEENKDNLYRHLIDSLILMPLKKKMKRKKLTINPTIIDLYYGLKIDYSDRRNYGNVAAKSYWRLIDGIGTLVDPEYKEKIKNLTGIEIKIPEEEEQEEAYFPNLQVHKEIDKLPDEMLSFFIPNFSTYKEFDEGRANSEYYELGIRNLVKQAYLSRMVLRYFGKYTDENELEFRRFTAIVYEALDNLSDNKVLVKVVEYARIIESKFEDVEEILRDYRRNPGNYLAKDSELLQLKLDSLIRQSDKE